MAAILVFVGIVLLIESVKIIGSLCVDEDSETAQCVAILSGLVFQIHIVLEDDFIDCLRT